MKVVGITILRTGAGDPIPLTMACDLSSYGFFQRQVSWCSLLGFGSVALRAGGTCRAHGWLLSLRGEGGAKVPHQLQIIGVCGKFWASGLVASALVQRG